ncbi:MAG: NUDIX domain-containing protein [Candidatus Altiarchaeales archaeon]|nr:NUDIX domain-containing protein [Candidatus Altiarchaeales archaeon]
MENTATTSPWVDDNLYKQILKNVPISCVDIAILHEGRILLVKRKDEPGAGRLWLPGGRVYKGELMRETAARKALEEVGISCNVGPIVHTAETIFDTGYGGIPVHSINICFFLYPTKCPVEVQLDSHHDGHVWVDTVPPDLDKYVRDCLAATGLDYSKECFPLREYSKECFPLREYDLRTPPYDKDNLEYWDRLP